MRSALTPLRLVFTSGTVKIHSLRFKATATAAQAPNGSGPKEVRLFINRSSPLDFEDAEDATPTQTLVLTPADLTGENPVELKFVKFQKVSMITLFVVSNQAESETTTITQIEFIGSPLDTTNMADFKRVAGKVGEGE